MHSLMFEVTPYGIQLGTTTATSSNAVQETVCVAGRTFTTCFKIHSLRRQSFKSLKILGYKEILWGSGVGSGSPHLGASTYLL